MALLLNDFHLQVVDPTWGVTGKAQQLWSTLL
jgi:hypothetical protein